MPARSILPQMVIFDLKVGVLRALTNLLKNNWRKNALLLVKTESVSGLRFQSVRKQLKEKTPVQVKTESLGL